MRGHLLRTLFGLSEVLFSPFPRDTLIEFDDDRHQPTMGAILLAHTAMEGMPIADEVMVETRIDRRPEPYEIVRLNPCNRPRDGFDEGLDWEELAERQEELYARELRPVMDAHPSWPIVYFGLVPIPLAVHLGALVGQGRAVEARLHHHGNWNWHWPKSSVTWRFARRPRKIPATPTHRDHVIIRVSTSYEIEPGQTNEVVKTPFCYDIQTRTTNPDSIRSSADLDALVQAYKTTLDDIANALPNASVRHLFASVPVGLAFRLGTVLNPNLHLPLQTWKHMSRRRPEYRPAILIGPRAEKPRILVLAASPPDTRRTTATQEAREINDILNGCGSAIEVRLEEAVTREDLPDLLRTFDPTFIHFAGHGREGQQAKDEGLTRDIDPALVVHNNSSDDHACSLDLEDVARWIGERRRRTVVLTACHSDPIAKAAASNKSVCIGFKKTLYDGQARAFARAFWKSLTFAGQTVDHAFLDGKAQMDPKEKKLAVLHPPGGGSNIYLIPKGGSHG